MRQAAWNWGCIYLGFLAGKTNEVHQNIQIRDDMYAMTT